MGVETSVRAKRPSPSLSLSLTTSLSLCISWANAGSTPCLEKVAFAWLTSRCILDAITRASLSLSLQRGWKERHRWIRFARGHTHAFLLRLYTLNPCTEVELRPENACVRACVRVCMCVRACVRVCVCVCQYTADDKSAFKVAFLATVE